jgi:ADP-ribosylation factor GTPase-activating protein 2/3
VTSSALRSSGATGGPMRLGTKPSKLGASKLGGSKLGAKKAATGINFEEAQRKALEEEERIKRLGYDKQKEEEEAAALKAREEEERRKNQTAGINSSRSATPLASASRTIVVEETVAPARLGFGQVAAAPVEKKTVTRQAVPEDTMTAAKDRFGTQKAISSDMYFSRGNYDSSAASEAKTRLQNFQGATAISSNAYFGRSEDDEDDADLNGGEGLLGIEGNETFQNLERGARDMASRVMADPSVQNLAEQIRGGALRLSDYLASFEGR